MTNRERCAVASAIVMVAAMVFAVPPNGGATGRPAHVRGRISESAKYERMHPLFGKAFALLRRSDLCSLQCGRYEIDGSNCWAMVSEVQLKPFASTNLYEVHRAFIDIQAPLSGPETMGVAKPSPKVFDGFDVEKDYVLFSSCGEPWTIEKGEFAVFFPGEGAHAPCLTVDGSRTVRKVVIKVRAKAPAPF